MEENKINKSLNCNFFLSLTGKPYLNPNYKKIEQKSRTHDLQSI